VLGLRTSALSDSSSMMLPMIRPSIAMTCPAAHFSRAAPSTCARPSRSSNLSGLLCYRSAGQVLRRCLAGCAQRAGHNEENFIRLTSAVARDYDTLVVNAETLVNVQLR